jgi:endoglucanase
VASGNSALKVHTLDFSSLKKEGIYRIVVEGSDSSYPFTVSATPHHEAAVAALKGFYFQRMSTTLSPVYAGKWARPFAHPDEHVLVHASAATEKRPEGTVISSPGGWYDAGDYNKYIVNSGITMGTLMSAYEDFPDYFKKERTGIPESDNALPDILDEVLWNLRWMMTMQDPNDGGVYHKCTNAAFDPMVMPSACTRNRYVVMKSTAAALDFAAVMAQAGRLFEAYEKQLPKLYDSCMRASRMSWNWALKNPNVMYDQDAMNKTFQPAITTGAYGDGHLEDEWFWASAELTASTGQDKYAKIVEAHMDLPLSLPSWNSVAMMGYHTLIREEKIFSPWIRVITKELRERTIRFADSLLNNADHNAFRTPMGGSPKDFVWGSSGVAANQGMLLIQATILTGNRKYIDGTIANADHLLGRNATGYCFLTGIGTYSTRHPHHRPSIADGIDDPVPGLLSGGPNPGKQDGCNYAFSEAETTYLDEDCSYASNEIAINWNAPLVYLLFGVEAISLK